MPRPKHTPKAIWSEFLINFVLLSPHIVRKMNEGIVLVRRNTENKVRDVYTQSDDLEN